MRNWKLFGFVMMALLFVGCSNAQEEATGTNESEKIT